MLFGWVIGGLVFVDGFDSADGLSWMAPGSSAAFFLMVRKDALGMGSPLQTIQLNQYWFR